MAYLICFAVLIGFVACQKCSDSKDCSPAITPCPSKFFSGLHCNKTGAKKTGICQCVRLFSFGMKCKTTEDCHPELTTNKCPAYFSLPQFMHCTENTCSCSIISNAKLDDLLG